MLPQTNKKKISKNKEAVFAGLHVLEINARKLFALVDSNEVKPEWKTEIESLTTDRFRIIVECRVAFDPPVFFDISTKYAIDYTHNGLTRQEIEKGLDALANPCGGRNTMIIAEISQHLQGNPLVIPPYIERDNK